MPSRDPRSDRTGLSEEQSLIREYFAPLAADCEGADAFEDDAFVLAPEDGYDLVITKDMLVAGTHFLPGDPADLVARKALRTNLSDLAAKGAEPSVYFLGLCIPRLDRDWIAAFADGLREDQGAFACRLAGGDTVRGADLLSVSITAIGRVKAGRAVRRGGAGDGDVVYVSGTIGDSVLGLALHKGESPAWAAGLSDTELAYLHERYLVPQPRVSLAAIVATHATAAMDVSDGLVGDLALLCRASKAGADIELDRVPLSDAGKKAVLAGGEERLAAMATGGDDYEILCTVPEEECAGFETACADAGCPVRAIGRIRASGERKVVVMGRNGHAIDIAQGSYSHISSTD